MVHRSIYHLSALTAWLIFLGHPVMAYIPPTDWIIDQMAQNCLEKTKKLNGILSTTLSFKDDLFVDLILSPKGLTIEKTTPLIGQRSPLASETPFSLYILDVLTSCSKQDQQPQSARIKKYLSDLKIDLNKVSLGFFGNEIVYIIGAEPKDDTRPQLWVDKSAFLVVREKTAEYEITFNKWHTLSELARAFPHVINLNKGGQQKNLSLSETL